MQNTIASVLFLLIVTGALFTGCSKQEDALTTENQGSLEESVMNDLTEGDEDEDGDEGVLETDSNAVETGAGLNSTNGNTGGNTGTDAATQSYKDGTYSATGSYVSPGGTDEMGVTLVLKEGVVTSVTITPKAGNETSTTFQENFAQNISALVVGKPLSDLGALGAVNGASLTPIGFNAAVASIKGLAQ